MAMNISRKEILFGLILLFAPLYACGHSFEITEETLAVAAADVLPLMEKETGVTLAGIVSVRLSTADEIGEVLRDELRRQFVSILGDESRAESEADSMAAMFSSTLYAKYAFEEKSILVCPENIEKLSDLLEEPLLRTSEGLRSVLVHEYVHAADDLRYDIGNQAESAASFEASQAFNAVVEGHAQFVARNVCDAAGWAAAFQAFTRSIGAFREDLVDENEQALLLMWRVLVQNVSSAYYDGEEFIKALNEAGGASAVERAFIEPPADLEEIQHPEWFLDPSRRPVATYDFDSGLDVMASRFDAEVWQDQKGKLTRPQIEAALSLLPGDEVGEALADLETTRYVMLQPKDDPERKLVLSALYEFGSEQGAATFKRTIDRLHLVKDEKMSEGLIRITSQHYEPLGLAGVDGTFSMKEVGMLVNMVSVVNVIAQHRNVCLEITFSGEAISHADVRDLAKEILIAAGVIAGQ